MIAVTHDRWFARGFDRYQVFGADGGVFESDEPVWEEGRVMRAMSDRSRPIRATSPSRPCAID